MRCWLAVLIVTTTSLSAPLSAADRVIAVGDLHGDFHSWRAITRAAHLTDASGRWRGGGAWLVQMGDVVDRGPDSLRILEDLKRLQREARRAGGRVIALVGNHEAMMVTNDLRYVHPGEYAAFVTRGSARLREQEYERQKAALQARDPSLSPAIVRQRWMAQTPLGKIEHRAAWALNGRLGRWVIGNPVVARIGDTLFVHGGISAEYSGLTIEQINAKAAGELAAATESETALINDPLGPLWYRGLITRGAESEEQVAGRNIMQAKPRPGIAEELSAVLAAYKAKRMVVGHTPSLRGIIIDQGGRLVRTDTGISRHYGGPLTYLEIVGDRLVTHKVPRPAEAKGDAR